MLCFRCACVAYIFYSFFSSCSTFCLVWIINSFYVNRYSRIFCALCCYYLTKPAESFPCVNEIICITLLRLVCVSSAHSSSHLQFFSAPLLVLLKFWSTLFPSDLFSYNLRVWCSAYFNFSNQAGPPKKERTPPPPPPAPPLEKRSSPTRY